MTTTTPTLFRELPLPERMRLAAEVLEKASVRRDGIRDEWHAEDLREAARVWEREDAQPPSPHEVIVQVMGNTFGSGDEYARDILGALESAGYKVTLDE